MIEYDPKSGDLCPLCGAYWQHDFEACAKEHGFTYKDESNRVPVLESFGTTDRDEAAVLARLKDAAIVHGMTP